MSLDAGRVGVRADQVDIHGRVTSPSFLNELLEDLPEWTDMPVWVNGTEEVLPSNTSVPVTSPILADIAYPDIRRDNQYFTYRESPTPVDGLAKIKSIKGNTLVWNQLAENGNFADGVGQWSTGGANTLSVTDGVCKIQSTNTSVNNHHIVFPDSSVFQNNHTYLVGVSARAYGNYIGANLYMAQQTNIISFGALIDVMSSSWQRGWLLFNRNDMTLTNGKRLALGGLSTVTTDDYFEVKDIVAFDLTQMGLDITDPSEFTSLFPLPYYDYNQGTLLSFNGNGIKTVGFNQWDEEWVRGYYNINTGALVINENTTIASKNHIKIVPNKQYYFNLPRAGVVFEYDSEGNFISRQVNIIGLYTPSQNAYTIAFHVANYGTLGSFIYNNDICVNISDASKNGTYEPYTSSTLSLPISTYFPSSMKSAGSVYDELTPRKAITRIGAVDMGTLSWNHNSTYEFFYADLVNAPPFTEALQKTLVCPIYETGTTVNSASQMANIDNKTIRGRRGVATTQIYVKDTSYSSATDLVNALSGVYLYYELATPVELPTLSLGD